MERRRSGLDPIGETFSGLDGPVKAIRDATPQAVHPLHPSRPSRPTCLGQRNNTG